MVTRMTSSPSGRIRPRLKNSTGSPCSRFPRQNPRDGILRFGGRSRRTFRSITDGFSNVMMFPPISEASRGSAERPLRTGSTDLTLTGLRRCFAKWTNHAQPVRICRRLPSVNCRSNGWWTALSRSGYMQTCESCDASLKNWTTRPAGSLRQSYWSCQRLFRDFCLASSAAATLPCAC